MQLVDQHLRIGLQVFDGGALTLSGPQGSTRLPLKAAQVLVVLAEQPGQTVTRERLLDRVWPDQFRTPDVLTQVIVELRRALLGGAATLVTVTKVGYRLQAEVYRMSPPGPLEMPAMADPAAPRAETPTPGHPARVPGTSGRRQWQLAAGLSLMLSVLALLWTSQRGPAVTSAAPAPPLGAPLTEVLSADPAAERWPALSPDGSRVAWSMTGADGRRQILLKVPGDSAQLALAPDPAADQVHPVWSPDGREVAFLSFTDNGCQVRAVAASGGAARVLRPCIPGVLTWFQWPEDQLLYTSFMGRGAPGLRIHRQRLDSDRDEPLQYPHHGHDHDAEPELSPDGRYLAFRRGRVHARLQLLDLKTRQLRDVTPVAALLAGHTWLAPDGLLVYATDAHGASELVAYDPATDRHERLGVTPAQHPQAARQARMLSYERPRQQTQLWSWPLEGSAPAAPVLPPSTGSDRMGRLRPDGEWLAFVSDRSGSDQVWVQRSAAAPQQWTRFHDRRIRGLSWHPDGGSLLVVLASADAWSAVVLDLATRREQPAPGVPGSIRSLQWSSSGAQLLAITEIDGMPHLVVLEQRTEGWSVVRQLAGVNAVAEQVDGMLLLTQEGQPGLFQLDPTQSAPVLLSDQITLVNQMSWTLNDGHVWFVDWSVIPTLKALGANGAIRTVRTLDVRDAVPQLQAELSLAHGRLIMTAVNQDQTDIALARWSR